MNKLSVLIDKKVIFALGVLLLLLVPQQSATAQEDEKYDGDAPGMSIPGNLVELRAENVDSFHQILAPSMNALSAEGARSTGATINVVYNPASCTGTTSTWPTEAAAAFAYATNIWGSLLTSSVPITVDACWVALGSGILGSAGATTYYRDFAGAPESGTFYPIPLVNALNGSDVNGSSSEIRANFSSSFSNWYFGTDGNTPAGQFDFVTVILHEIGHGLGFAGSMNKTNNVGFWGLGNPAFPTSYDRFTENGTGQGLLNTALFPNGSTALGTQLTSQDLFFNGPNVVAANGGRASLYAPSAWNGGSSYSHLGESFNGTPNALMTYSIGTAEVLHSPGPVGLALLKDIGWGELDPPMADDWVFNNDSGSYVNGSTSEIQVTGTGSNYAASFYRKDGSTFGHGNKVSFDFYVDDKDSKTHLSVAKVGGSYERLAILDVGGVLKAQLYRQGQSPLFVSQTLLTSTQFQADTWYSASITIDDDNGFLIEVEERGNPSVNGSFRDTSSLLASGSQWRFFGLIFQSSVNLDNYLEEEVTITPPPADDWVFNNDSGSYVDGSNSEIQVTGTGSNYAASFYRKDGSTFGHGNKVSFDFYVDDKDSKTHLSVAKVGGSYERLAILDVGGVLKAQLYRQGQSPLFVSQTLLTSTQFQADTWYSASISIDDDNGFLIEVEERGNPSVNGSFRDTGSLLASGSQWRFFGLIFQSSVNLDNYLEEEVTITPPPADDWVFNNGSGSYVNGSNSQIAVIGTGTDFSARFWRKDGRTYQDGETISFDFYVDQIDSKSHLSFAKVGGDFERLAILDNGNGLQVQIYRPNQANRFTYYTLLTSAQYQANTWYSATVTIDDTNGFSVSVAERDTPSVSGSFQDAGGLLATGSEWSFLGMLKQHTVSLDNYLEE